MSFVSSALRKIVFWNYPRTSWQWDVLCVLILVFIFLTPKSWFANTSYGPQTPHTIVVLEAETLGPQPVKAEIERRAKEVAKRPEARQVDIRPLWDSAGKIKAYEVDIR